MSYIVQQSTATSRKIVGIAGAGIGKETHFIEVKTDGTLRDHVGTRQVYNSFVIY